MGVEGEEKKEAAALHVVFFPLMAHGHMIPLFDVARLFAGRGGVKATVVTTPANAPVFSNNKANNIHIETIPFPSKEVGLPDGWENFEYITGDDILDKFVNAIRLLENPLEQVLERLHPRPSCLVSDLFLPWTLEVAERFGMPRLVFHGTGYFPISVSAALMQHRSFLTEGVESDDKEFVVPGVPGDVKLTRRKMSLKWKDMDAEEGEKSGMAKMVKGAFEAETRSFGVIMNSFDELEPNYVDHYRMGRRTWSIGPVSLCNRSAFISKLIDNKSITVSRESLVRLGHHPN